MSKLYTNNFHNKREIIIGFIVFPFVSFKIIVANKSERIRIQSVIGF